MQKRFIEYDLPLADISEESAREKSAPLASTSTHQHASRIPCHNPSRTPTDGSKRR